MPRRSSSTAALMSLFAILVLAGSPAAACGGADEPCAVALGGYHVAAPPMRPGEPTRPVVVHFHGFGSLGADVVKDRALVDPFVARGYVVIAPNGLGRPGRPGGGWSFRPEGPKARDELAFVRQVLDDAGTRFHIDRDRVLLTGFSIGGSLVWYLACAAPADFAAYAPVAGGFWRPHPTTCAGPVRMLHTHGWRDQTVPLEGRPLGGGAIRQGDIFEALQTWRQVNGCTGVRADEFSTDATFWRRRWTRCMPGSALELVLHPDPHGIPEGWPILALDWFEAQVPPRQLAQ